MKIMKKFKEGETIPVPIATAAWLMRNKFEIPAAFQSFFPSDALGARGIPEQEVGYPKRGVVVEFDYGTVQSETDLATRIDGVMRPRDSKATRKFYEANSAEVGDVVYITKFGDRHYKVELIKK